MTRCLTCQVAETAEAMGTAERVIRSMQAEIDRLLSERLEVAELRRENAHLRDVIDRQNKRLRRTA